jgi:AbrB family looped-hinge helix DNA binding protein
MNGRGALTIPKELRRRLGLKEGGRVVVEETDHGLLLRRGAAPAVEIYTDERVAEFARNNEEALAGYRLKK